MRKTFLTLLSLGVLLGSCSKDEDVVPDEPRITHSIKAFLRFDSSDTCRVEYSSQCLPLFVRTNVRYNLSIRTEGDSWVEGSVKGYNRKYKSDELLLEIEENRTNAPRSAEIVICTDDRKISDTLILKQERKDTDRLCDGEVVTLQESFVGEANIVIMGDGFTAEHLENGYYEKAVRQAAEDFFSIEPYSTYRDYFNVHMVAVESETDKFGSGGLSGAYSKKTRFRTTFGTGTEINCDDKTVFEYIGKIQSLPDDSPVLCILVLNIDRYAGTCYMYLDGNSIAMCPMSTLGANSGFDALIHHEAGGHGFGFFADEYVYYSKQMPQSDIANIKQWQESGYQMNLDFTDNPQDVHWSSFVGLDGYDGVGVYEGAQEYAYGVYKSEQNSCMNDNIPYYSVYCRWLIYERIMKLSGKSYSMEEFLENDHVIVPYSLNAGSNPSDFVPTSPPVWKGLSPRSL